MTGDELDAVIAAVLAGRPVRVMIGGGYPVILTEHDLDQLILAREAWRMLRHAGVTLDARILDQPEQ